MVHGLIVLATCGLTILFVPFSVDCELPACRPLSRCVFSQVDQALLEFAYAVFSNRANEGNFRDLTESVTIPGISFKGIPHIIFKTLPLDGLPEVTKGVCSSPWQGLVSLDLHPEGRTLGFALVLKRDLENFDGLSYCVSNMLFAEPKPLAVVMLVVLRKVPIFVEQLPVLDAVGDPSSLVNRSLEIVLGGERVTDGLKLVGEALMEF